MPLRRAPVTAAEQREPVVEPSFHLVDRHAADARGRQLDGEGGTVQPRTDAPHGVHGQDGSGTRRTCPLGEQPDGGPVGLDGQGCERCHDLAGDGERCPRGGEHPELRVGGEQVGGERGDPVDEVLAVVQHEDRRSVAEGSDDPAGDVRDDDVPQRAGGAHLGDPEQGGERGDDVLGGPERSELDDHDRGVGRQPGGDRLREAGLAEPARTEDRDQPVAGQEVRDGGEVRLPSDQRVRRGPQPDPAGGARCRNGAAQQVGVQPDEVAGRVRTELLDEPVAVGGEDGECLARPTGGVERAHAAGHGEFVERVRRGLREPDGRRLLRLPGVEEQPGESRRSDRRAAAARSDSAVPVSPSTSAPGSPRHRSSAARTAATSSLEAACSARSRSTSWSPSAYPVAVETTTPGAVLRRSRDTSVWSAARAPFGCSVGQSSSMSVSVDRALPRARTSATTKVRARAPGSPIAAPSAPATVTGPRTAMREADGTFGVYGRPMRDRDGRSVPRTGGVRSLSACA